MATKKRQFSAKQLAAQRKFAAMARARAKAAKRKKNAGPYSITDLAAIKAAMQRGEQMIWVIDQNGKEGLILASKYGESWWDKPRTVSDVRRIVVNPSKHLSKASAKDNRMYTAIKKTERALGKGLKEAKRIAAATVRKFQGKKNPVKKGLRSSYAYSKRVAKDQGKKRELKLRSLSRSGVSRVRALKKRERAQNRTVIKAGVIEHVDVSKVHNPRKRVKIQNKYIDLVIKGQATKTPQGWQIGKKTFAQGRGMAKVASGYFLDRATGIVYAKRERNLDHRDAQHPIHVSQYWQGRKGYLTPWQRAHAAGQEQLFDTGIKVIKRKNPSVKKIRESFVGQKSRRVSTMSAPNGTPANLAKLGRLISIKARRATVKPSRRNPSSAVWLCADGSGKLHLCTTGERLFDGPAQDFGEVREIEYETAKPHLGHPTQTIFFHKMGEEGGRKPHLIADGEGGLKFKGGSYKITAEGIRD